jgi:hypothetical protein
MKRGGKTLICLLCASAVTTGVNALVNDAAPVDPANGGTTPYSAIWLRNVFDLKPPPPPPVTAPVSTGPPSNIQLKGITTMHGTKRVMIDVQAAGSTGKSYIMREGERQGELEILEINPKTATVKIKNDDVVSTITFSTNAVPAGVPGSPAPMVGGPGMMRPPAMAPPGFNPAPVPLNNSGFTPTPVRPVRTTDYSGGSPQGYVQPTGISAGYVSAGATAGLNLGNLLTQAPPSPGMITPMPNVPPVEDQIANLVQQHQMHDSVEVAAGTMPPLPPIPARYGGTDTQDTQAPSPPTPGGESSLAPPAPPAFTPTLPAWLKARATGTLNQSQ